ncbi:hypothetical protein EFR01_41600 [Sinorhizobium fredii]|nr:hypothetical protein EFR01_41600 [Sinorhizobium fredii]GLS07785.1 hypothetical protein GCM10007864_14120 [Sinorhizobium fredii]
MEMCFHVEMGGDHMSLVYSAAAGAANIHFLQGDNVGSAFTDDRGDARRVELPVGPEAAMDVVGEET